MKLGLYFFNGDYKIMTGVSAIERIANTIHQNPYIIIYYGDKHKYYYEEFIDKLVLDGEIIINKGV